MAEAPITYQSGSCHSNLPNWGGHTGGLQSSLRAIGWTGNYWTGPSAFPSDFIDSNKDPHNGRDWTAADRVDLAIFNGHGNVNDLAFAYPDGYTGICDAGYFGNLTSSNISLGAGGGGYTKAALFMAVTCCYVDFHHFVAELFFGGNQILGFGSEAVLDSSEINEFYSATGGSSGRNWSAWLNNLEDRPGWGTGNNSSVSVTLGWNVADAIYNKSTCGLRRGTCWTRLGYSPGTTFLKDWYDNGCGGCANCGS